MIWLSWRQQRFESTLTGLAFAAAAGLLLLTHQQLLHTFADLGIPGCLRGHSSTSACLDAYDAFKQDVSSEQTTINWLAYLPILLGVLLAATLALELEDGSYRLSWTQSVTRGRWAFGRIGFSLATALATATGLSLIAGWWLRPLNRLQSPLLPGSFEIAGVVPIAYALLGFAATLLVAVIWRRTLPALGTGAASAFAAHLLLQHIRPTLIAPLTRVWVSGPAPYSRRDWLITGGSGATNYQYVDAHGHSFSAEQIQQLCGHVSDSASKDHYVNCLLTHRLGELIRLQPANRFWELQLLEAGIVVLVAVALLGSSIWWLRTRAH